MEKDGLVGQPDHVGRREVLIDPDGPPDLSLNATGTARFSAHSKRETPVSGANFQEFSNEFHHELRARAGAGRRSSPRRPRPRPRIRPTWRGSRRTSPSVQSMTANFVQTDARGRSAAGTLQLKRPGKVRFQYGSGDLLLVANGKTLTFIDYQVGQKSSWPLAARRSACCCRDRPTSRARAQIVAEQRSAGRRRPRPRPVAIWHADARLPAQRRRRRAGCSSTAGPRSTPQNQRTTVKLSNVRYNVAVPESAFTYAEPKKR